MDDESFQESILTKIIREKSREVEAAKRTLPLQALQERCRALPKARGFGAALRTAKPFAVIAEVKRASPSKGIIRPDLQPVETAVEFSQAGAACLSVLTDEKFFQGKLEYLEQIRARLPQTPLLRKDFTIDPYQVWETRAAGADAILLIVAALGAEQLRELLAESLVAGLDILVEAHSEEEFVTAYETIDLALQEPQSSEVLLGINNRDLNTFETDLEVSRSLLAQLEKIRTARGDSRRLTTVSESGIFSGNDLYELSQAGAKAFLIGEALVRSGSPGENLKTLLRDAVRISRTGQ